MSYRKAALAGTAGTAVAVAVLGIAASPAFAKSDSTLTGPRTASAGHPFRLTVRVGDDAGARPARARLQVRDAHGHFHWLGAWHQLRRTSYPDESWTFTVAEGHRGPVAFRAVITGYATTSTVTVAVRLAATRRDRQADQPRGLELAQVDLELASVTAGVTFPRQWHPARAEGLPSRLSVRFHTF